MTISPAKTVQLIEMSFGMLTSMRSRNHMLDEVYMVTTSCVRMNSQGLVMMGAATTINVNVCYYR